MRWLVVLAALSGCDYVFHITEVGPSEQVPGDGVIAVDAHVRPDGQPLGCPNAYDKQLDTTASLYRLVLSTTSWQTAEQDCANDAPGLTHLIVLSNKDEWRSLITLPATFLVDDTWVGATATKLGGVQFQWVTSENTNGFVVPAVLGAEPWEADQPDGSSECGELRALSGSLHDTSCSSSSNYICECDAHPEVPASF